MLYAGRNSVDKPSKPQSWVQLLKVSISVGEELILPDIANVPNIVNIVNKTFDYKWMRE